MKKLKKILVANRGEIAVRILRACREEGIASVAIYSDADRNALHVRHADEAYRIGAAPVSDSYLRMDRILDVAKGAGCDSVHPGYGLLSENADFVEACEKASLIFVGPSAHAVREMGDKVRARERMKSAGVPVTPGSDGAIGDVDQLRKVAEEIGYPVMIKASAGGGGKGIRVVKDRDQLEPLFEMARSEAEKSFANGEVYLEKFLEKPRHVEIQILADGKGHVIHLCERDCSIQRRHQKVIEEAPSPVLGEEIRHAMGEAAVKAAREVDYCNAGTVEFLLQEDGSFYFLEMNTRLQVEHPITEQVTGVDIVREQLRIAAGNPLLVQQEDVTLRGHAIEARICAEDPSNNFFPATGTIKHIDVPGGGRVRIDAGLYEGMRVDVHYDSMLAKLIVRANDREEAISRMKRALSEFHITGVKTNIGFLLRVLESEEFSDGTYDTGFIERNEDQLLAPPEDEEERVVSLLAVTLAHELRRMRSREGRPAVLDATISPWRRAFRESADFWAGD